MKTSQIRHVAKVKSRSNLHGAVFAVVVGWLAISSKVSSIKPRKDLHEFLGGPSICPTTPHPITGESVPLTFGHEFSGTIEELGEGVSGKFKPGDRVCVQPIIYCGDCGACKDGGESRVWYTMRTISDFDSAHNCCYSNGFVGLSGWGGGLAEHLVSDILNSEQVVLGHLAKCGTGGT